MMLCLQSDLLEMPRPALASFVSETLRAWGVTPDRVGVVEGIPGVDRSVFDLIEPELPGARFYPFTGVWAHGLPAGPGQVWISTRFHMHMLAAAAGADGVAVAVNPDYYSTKHRSLIDRGSGLDAHERPACGGTFGPGRVRSADAAFPARDQGRRSSEDLLVNGEQPASSRSPSRPCHQLQGVLRDRPTGAANRAGTRSPASGREAAGRSPRGAPG